MESIESWKKMMKEGRRGCECEEEVERYKKRRKTLRKRSTRDTLMPSHLCSYHYSVPIFGGSITFGSRSSFRSASRPFQEARSFRSCLGFTALATISALRHSNGSN